MYKCDDCGCVFDEPSTYRDEICVIDPVSKNTAYDEYPCCPRCNSYQFDEVWECEICGEYYHEGETYCETVDKCYCKDCVIEEMSNDYTLFKQFLKKCSLEKEFYVEYLFDSNPEGVSSELLYLAQRDFESDIVFAKNKENCKKAITEFLRMDSELIELAAEIIDEN